MKLYELERGARFQLEEDPHTPPGSLEPIRVATYTMQGLDGMYCKVDDQGGNRHYFAAWTEVEPVKEPS